MLLLGLMGFTGIHRIIYLALMAVVLAAPFAIPVPWVAVARWMAGGTLENPGFLPAPRDNQAWFVVFGSGMAGLMAAAWGRWSLFRLYDGSWNLVGLAGIAWFVYALVRSSLVPWAGSAYSELLMQGAFFLLFLAAAGCGATWGDLRQLQVGLCAVVLPLAVLALVQNAGFDPLPYSPTVAGLDEEVAGKQLIASTFGHPNYMGSYLAPVVVLAVALMLAPVGLGLRLLGGVAAVLAMMALVVGGTRGPILAVVAGLLVLILVGRQFTVRQAWRLILGAVAAAGVIAAAMWLVPALRPGFEITDRLFAGKEVASRVYYWVIGLEMFRAAPVFGVGLGQFDLGFWQAVAVSSTSEPGGAWYFVLESVIRGVRPGHMHNDHLQVVVELGVVGGALWVLLWGSMLDRAFMPYNTFRELQGVNPACFGALAAIGVDGLFGFPLHLPCSGALFWVLLGLWAGMNRNNS